MSPVTWTDCNQRFLAAEFARLKALLTGGVTATSERERAAVRAAMSSPPAIEVLAQLFGLSEFERDVVLLCAGVEMDSGLADHCMESSASGRPYATFGIALAGLPDAHWSALTPIRPLRRWRLLEVGDARVITRSQVSVDERVLHYLAGINYLDPRLQSIVQPEPVESQLAESQHAVVQSIASWIAACEPGLRHVYLHGDDASAQQEVARRIAKRLGLEIYSIAAQDLPDTVDEANALATLWSRESRLCGAALLVTGADCGKATSMGFVRNVAGACFISGTKPVLPDSHSSSFRVDRPMASEQRRLWSAAIGVRAAALNGSSCELSTACRLDVGTIRRAAAMHRGASKPLAHALDTFSRTCRSLIRQRLDGIADCVDAVATWEDLVLPDSQIAVLRQIAVHSRRRLEVYEQWGFAGKCRRGLGISVLFTGESGTGKTMAAEVLANELNLDLYRIDLSAIVSKYIGETEKNLRRVFEAAEEGGAILLFDEADALFGKRSEVKDSHDRYANVEISYLLQRMEAYEGLAILTTNLKKSLDIAFQRRLRFVVQFPFPDQQLREQIWRKSFPAATPLAPLDYERLARLNVTGGNIRNIALNAAFLAAEAGAPVSMNHLLCAAHGEAAKRERPLSESETRGWG